MHLTAQILTIIGIPLLGIPAFIICIWGLYYSLQAFNNLKPDSQWPKSSGGMAEGYPMLVPRNQLPSWASGIAVGLPFWLSYL